VAAAHFRVPPFRTLDVTVADATWNGEPTTLAVNENVNMPQTPSGTTILSWENKATENNLGELMITSGGGAPVSKYADALANQPSIWLKNWDANNLSITNVSANTATPILIQAIGPGIPGTNPAALPVGNPGVALDPGDMAQGDALPQYMQLVVTCHSATLGVVAFIGGPQDDTGNNGYVVQVNAQQNSGPDGPTPPIGYYATTTSNAYTFQFNWGSSLVFVANMSPSMADPIEVVMRAL
jgi:hypothetical protein